MPLATDARPSPVVATNLSLHRLAQDGLTPATSAPGLRRSAQDVLTQLPPKRRQRIVLELEGEAAAEAEGTMADLREMWDKQPDRSRQNFSLFKGWKQAGLAKARGRSHLGSPARKHAPSVDTAGSGRDTREGIHARSCYAAGAVQVALVWAHVKEIWDEQPDAKLLLFAHHVEVLSAYEALAKQEVRSQGTQSTTYNAQVADNT